MRLSPWNVRNKLLRSLAMLCCAPLLPVLTLLAWVAILGGGLFVGADAGWKQVKLMHAEWSKVMLPAYRGWLDGVLMREGK